MTMPLLWSVGFAGAVLATVGLAGPLARHQIRRLRASHANRAALWDRFYRLDWGDVDTNNYGFAPTAIQGAQRFQLQMYRELADMYEESGLIGKHTDLLEVSCGRAGGLAHLARTWPGSLQAIGIDIAQSAVNAASARHGDVPGLGFTQGSALALPFADDSFDAVLNVEASNDYGDYAGFFGEVRRVLRPGGAFLYTDTRRAELVEPIARMLDAAGFDASMRDITGNVIAACSADTPRRRTLVRTRVHFPYTLLSKTFLSYAGVEGSSKFRQFVSGERRYLMTVARLKDES